MKQASYRFEALKVSQIKTPVVLLLAFWMLFYANTSAAQLACLNDGVTIDFQDRGGSVNLRDVRVREITGNRRRNRSVELNGPGTLDGIAAPGSISINSLSQAAFPDEGIPGADFTRRSRRVWEARFPRGLYEFNNRGQLELDIEVTAIGGQAAHVSGGSNSIASVDVTSRGVQTQWYGGGSPHSLRRLRGTLEFEYSDLEQLALSGTHRVRLSICVTVTGNI